MATRADTLFSFIDELQRVERLLAALAAQNHTMTVATREDALTGLVEPEPPGVLTRNVQSEPCEINATI
jgi:hypothetical protein